MSRGTFHCEILCGLIHVESIIKLQRWEENGIIQRKKVITIRGGSGADLPVQKFGEKSNDWREKWKSADVRDLHLVMAADIQQALILLIG